MTPVYVVWVWMTLTDQTIGAWVPLDSEFISLTTCQASAEALSAINNHVKTQCLVKGVEPHDN